MAEGIMKNLVKQHHLDWTIDSAGTEYYHVGQLPDRRAIQTCGNCNIDITERRARRITYDDLNTFDVVYALADDVLDEINALVRGRPIRAELKLLLDEVYPGEGRSVPDPWYGVQKDFDPVFKMLQEACEAVIMKYAPHPTT